MTTDVPRLMTRSPLIPLAVALLLGCSGTAAGRPRGEGPARVRPGQEFRLRVGQRAAVKGGRFGVRFASVANDSRCPPAVTCVWAGNAEVRVEAEAGGATAVLKLNTHGGDAYPKEARHGRYVVALVGLSPQPARGGGAKAADYVVTLVIRKV
ncbi:MAG TPA: hypothetical protein VF736_03180 [Pyrinomonadaceae bacterium]|jgi:hypothetical protein